MKKLIFAFVLLFGTMFASCNNGHSETTTEAVDSVEVVTDSVSSDTICVDTLTVDNDTVNAIQ